MAKMMLFDGDPFEAVNAKLDAISKRLDQITGGDRWLSVKDTAAEKGVSVATVNAWVRDGRYEARGSGKAREVRPASS